MSVLPPDTGATRPSHVLQVWLSPAFPVGSFAYSHGLEWAVASGSVHDLGSAEAWLADLLTSGAPRNDAILLALAWRTVSSRRDEDLAELNVLALAMAGSRERHIETTQQGRAFLTTIGRAWPCTRLVQVAPRLEGKVAYPVAVGCAAGAHDLALDVVVPAFLICFIQNLVSALVRLSVIGQTDGQRVIAALMPQLDHVAAMACSAGHDLLGGAAFLSDIAAMAHETQETRLFRS